MSNVGRVLLACFTTSTDVCNELTPLSEFSMIILNDSSKKLARTTVRSLVVIGKPEWKCEALPATPKNCCVESKSTQSPSTKPICQSNSVRPEPPCAYRGKTMMQRFGEKLQSFTIVASDYGRRIGRFCQKIAHEGMQAVQTVVLYLWAFLKALFYTNVPSKTLPSTPRPFLAKKSDSGSFSKVEFNPNELNTAYEVEKMNTADSAPQKELDCSTQFVPIPSERHNFREEEVPVERTVPQAMPRKNSSNSKALYQDNSGYNHQQEKQYFTDTSLDTLQSGASAYIEEYPMFRLPTPPPPAPPPPTKPIRVDSVVHGREDVDQGDRETYQNNETNQKRKDPPGIGKLPADVMAELHGKRLRHRFLIYSRFTP
uniref:Uncharacterized protein n=1 Tax=Angiostrongylus cantonensis TaxID=6313 RepID=A0A158PCT5_ANGCA